MLTYDGGAIGLVAATEPEKRVRRAEVIVELAISFLPTPARLRRHWLIFRPQCCPLPCLNLTS